MKRGLVAAVAGLTVLSGCSAPAAEPPAPPVTSSTTLAPLPTPTPYAGALEDLLLPIPAGAQPFVISNFSDSDTDIVKTSKLWNAKDADNIAALFKKSGFQRSAIRAWQDASGNVVAINLVQLRDDTGVNDWIFWASGGLTAGNTSATGRISEVNNGKWAELVYDDLHHLTLICFRGQIALILYVDSKGAGNVDLLKSVAVDQFNKLPTPS